MTEQETARTKTQATENYQAKHEAKPEIEETLVISVEVPSDGYYKERIKALQDENAKLRDELRKKENQLEQFNRCIDAETGRQIAREVAIQNELAKKDQRIAKLEKALVEASIR